MPVSTPHKLTIAEVKKAALDGWYVMSDVITADATQYKRLLVAHGRHLLRVDRKYYVEFAGAPTHSDDASWEIVYEGENPAVAVEAYNRLG